MQNTQELWDNREQVLATLESGGIGGACVLTVGGEAYMAVTRERRELMREWGAPLHEALCRPLGYAEQTGCHFLFEEPPMTVQTRPTALQPV
ncbi:hypothetical protein [Streptomyces sp. NPDC127066]|uniref:hypothetical protein n=1 Tax=Streptomyces sp. NPDC127066 TaxID=3347125 RepID=UPI0036693149